MKFSLLVALAIIFSTAGQACSLSADDIEALAASPSHLTPSDFSAAPPQQQEMVCSTRAFIKKIDAQKGNMTEMEKYSTKYLTPAENHRMIAASDKYLDKIMRSKGL
jgi:hypothetical protein